MKVYVFSCADGRFAYSLDSWGLDLPDGCTHLGILLDQGVPTLESENLRRQVADEGVVFLVRAPADFGCQAVFIGAI